MSPAPKYLERDATSGLVSEVVATASGTAANSVVTTGAGGTIDPSLLPASGAATAVAGETINAGSFVYVRAADGKLYNAVWSAGGEGAIGYVTASYSAADVATYYSSGQNTALTALSQGVRYYGDKTTAGGVTLTVPTGAGVVHQFLGYSVSTTAIESDITDVIILAS